MKKYVYRPRSLVLAVLMLFVVVSLCAQQQYKTSVKPVKNVIFMIVDGTSTSVLSVARWYQMYNNPGMENLYIDPYLCGMVKNYSSNAPVPDSAPAMSAYTTGVPTRTGYVSLYPQAEPQEDIYPIDEARAFEPLATVMEAAKIEKKKAIGVVVTVDFCHATPAACISHHYKRNAYNLLAPQFAYSDMDVVFGGGSKSVSKEMKSYFEKNNTRYLENDVDAFRSYDGSQKLWALFSEGYLPYDLDRNEKDIPSLAEMTEKALQRLSKNENGFFLMVEGSQVDAAAHATDPIGVITEFLAFDKAVGVAIDFAKRNGETAVVIMPDHGNSALNLAGSKLPGYTSKGLSHSFANVSKYKKTAKGLENILLKTKAEDIKKVFKQYTDIDITDEELNTLLSSKNYETPDYTQVGTTVNMISTIAKIMTSHTNFEFISGTHTGEDLFLAAYHPNGDKPYGLNTGIEINHYLCDLIGLEEPLSKLTEDIYVKHTEVFADMEYRIDDSEKSCPKLSVRKGRNVLLIPAFRSVAYLNGKPIHMGSNAIYIDKNKTFYVPKELKNKL